MSGMLRRGMSWLGLGPDEGDYDDYDDYDDPGYDDVDDYMTGSQSAVVRPVPSARAAAPRAPEVDPEWDDVAEPSAVRVLPTAGGGVRPTGPVAEPVRQGGTVVRPVPATPTSARPHIVTPQSFNDAQEVGDFFKRNQPVIVNLQGLDRDLARRLLDFSSGVAYGLGGSVERVAAQVFLLTPTDVQVSADERRRLRDKGLIDR